MKKIVELFKKTHSSFLRDVWRSYLHWKYKKLYNKDPRLAADALFYKIYGKYMNLSNPKHFIEKVTWMELNTDLSLWTQCADKYRMRDFVKQHHCEQYLPKLYGHWDDPESIDFAELPSQFVIKANNGCGTVKIIKDRNKINQQELVKELKEWLKEPFGYMGGQIHYMNIKPCIIAEELVIQDDYLNILSPESIVDFKVWCFNGKAEYIFIGYNRTVNTLGIDFFDVEWNRHPELIVASSHFRFDEHVVFPKPSCLDEMIMIAEKLASAFVEIRVDFYISNGHPVIGELTLSSGYGYFTEDFYNYMGSKIDLNKVKVIKQIK